MRSRWRNGPRCCTPTYFSFAVWPNSVKESSTTQFHIQAMHASCSGPRAELDMAMAPHQKRTGRTKERECSCALASCTSKVLARVRERLNEKASDRLVRCTSFNVLTRTAVWVRQCCSLAVPIEGIRAAKSGLRKLALRGFPRPTSCWARAANIWSGSTSPPIGLFAKSGRPPHEIARLLSIAKIIHHELDAVAIGIFVVKGCRSTVIRRADGLDLRAISGVRRLPAGRLSRWVLSNAM